VTAAGDAAFRKKTEEAFKQLANRASIIMVAHNDGVLKAFCESGVLLSSGKATWFDKLDDALHAYKESI
jgi:ABC-type polysaccharide/polyol phosphate transport system, ATPase component